MQRQNLVRSYGKFLQCKHGNSQQKVHSGNRYAMKSYFEGYNDGVKDIKRNILEIIEKHQLDEPRDMLAAIIMFCE